MSAYDLDEFYVTTVQVEMFLGTTGYGVDTFAAPVQLLAWSDEARRLVRDKNGQQVVSEGAIYTYPVNAPLFTADSRVTIDGNVSRVIKTSINDSGALDLPDHVEVSLT